MRMGAMGKKLRARDAARIGLQVGTSKSLEELLSSRGISLRRQASVLRWVALWGIFVTAAGREPRNVEELSAGLKVKVRTAYEYQAAFREGFPEFDTPAALWTLVVEGVNAEDVHPVVLTEQLGAVKIA